MVAIYLYSESPVTDSKLSIHVLMFCWQVSVETTPEATICLCDHLTSFGSSFFVPPNKIDFDNITVDNLLKSPLVLIVVSTLFALYLLLLIPARRADRSDLAKVKKGKQEAQAHYCDSIATPNFK